VNEIQMRLPIAGMTCVHCETAVRQALEGAGAHDARTSFRTGEATFTLPAVRDPATLQEAVRQAGYEPGQIERLAPTAADHRRKLARGDYDLAIVGSGAAAFAAAITAHGQGARVVMVERGTIGGTCVNIGCIPSKTLIRASEVYHSAARHPFAGIETHAGTVDFGAAVTQKNELVNHLRQEKYANLVGEYDWDLIIGEGDARFRDASTLSVGARAIRAAHYILAPGARPAMPPIQGLVDAEPLTSTEALNLTALPRSLVIIGAGYIALELGQLFRRLGTRVTLLQRGERLLPDYEPEVAEAVGAMLARDGIEVLTGAHVQRVERDGLGRRVRIQAHGVDRVLAADHVVVAAGRVPNTEALNLPAAGIATNERGAIVVDEHLRTSNPRVFAAGDVTLAPQYVYVAAYQGGLAAKNALTDARTAVDLTALPGVIFTDPQVAVVGLTEAQAREAGFDVKTSVLPVSAIPRAQVNYEEAGVFKLIADAATDRVLGAHIVAGNAGDVIYAATLAVKHRLTVADLVGGFAPYLTMAEGLKLGALTFDRDVSKLSCCAA
jgi:mercuric reductase